ncbi:hypothetical protein, partial [Vibrio cholerae]|uniref:hypothetical protein n=1 Tax=Vibrio cholerae TaxID=666 RepID=UPI001C8E85F7
FWLLGTFLENPLAKAGFSLSACRINFNHAHLIASQRKDRRQITVAGDFNTIILIFHLISCL